MNEKYNVYLVSDSTGETLDRIFLSLKSQFKNFEYVQVANGDLERKSDGLFSGLSSSDSNRTVQIHHEDFSISDPTCMSRVLNCINCFIHF